MSKTHSFQALPWSTNIIGQNYYRYDSGASRKVKLGDIEGGFGKADYVLEERYDSSPIEHAPTETTGCIVVPDQNNRLTCYTGTQAIFFTLDNASIILDTPGQRLHFIGRHGGRWLRRQGRLHCGADYAASCHVNRPTRRLHLQSLRRDADLFSKGGRTYLH